MKLPLFNVVLALIWATITGSFSLVNLVFGFVLGALALYLIRDEVGTIGYLTRSMSVLRLSVSFLRELLLSAWRVARIVLTPNPDLKPGIFAYRLKVKTDFQITLLANLITLTPGTLSVDVSEDRTTLYVHAIDCSDPQAARDDIANGFERQILEAFG